MVHKQDRRHTYQLTGHTNRAEDILTNLQGTQTGLKTFSSTYRVHKQDGKHNHQLTGYTNRAYTYSPTYWVHKQDGRHTNQLTEYKQDCRHTHPLAGYKTRQKTLTNLQDTQTGLNTYSQYTNDPHLYRCAHPWHSLETDTSIPFDHLHKTLHKIST